MNLSSLPIVGQLYLPFLLTSLIIGMLVLILLEKRKTTEKGNAPQTATLRETTTSLQATQEPNIKATKDKKEEEETVPNNTHMVKNKENCNTEQGQEDATKEDALEEAATHSSSASSCSSSSGSEEEVGRSQASRPRRVVQRPKKKHACKGSAILCATKRKVTAVTIITDSQEEEVQVSLEDLAGEIRSQGVTCSVHPATTTHLPPLSSEPSHLLLLFGTTSEGCKLLQESLTSALGGSGGDVPSPPPQPFLFSVTCWSAAASGDVFESARDLSTSLAGRGGAEWLPITCITPTDGAEGESEPPVMARRQYVKTVMEKITKPGKKCCGTSCGSKTVDIEDLASSLLPPRAAVTS